jgi:hypothetical protein
MPYWVIGVCVFDVEEYQRLYLEWNGGFTLLDGFRIVSVVVVFFVLPYVYIRFVEGRLKTWLVSFEDRLGNKPW